LVVVKVFLVAVLVLEIVQHRILLVQLPQAHQLAVGVVLALLQT
jgi:hypothetical protein